MQDPNMVAGIEGTLEHLDSPHYDEHVVPEDEDYIEEPDEMAPHEPPEGAVNVGATPPMPESVSEAGVDDLDQARPEGYIDVDETDEVAAND